MPACAGAALVLSGASPQAIEDSLSRWREETIIFLRYRAPQIVVILVVAIILLQLLRLLTRKLEAHSHHKHSHMRAQQMRTLAGIIQSVGIALIVFLATMESLETLGVNIGPLLASAGIAGLAIGFGAQALVKDVINGFV